VDFIPIVGDIKGGLEAVNDPTPSNVLGAIVGLVPIGGDIAKTALKHADEVGEGTKVFRVFGENNNPLGQSWTTVDPRTVDNFRDAAGLPDVNTGRFVAEGRKTDMSGVSTRSALPLDGNKGGLPEVLIPNAANQVRLERVSGVNQEF